jgi:hypothetical protein
MVLLLRPLCPRERNSRNLGRSTVRRFRRRNNETPVSAASYRLIDAAEAFLSGDYANYLRRRSDTVPGWARLNTFAHGDLESVRQVGQLFPATVPERFAGWSEETWKIAQRVLAKELLDLVHDDSGTLSRVQQKVLLPLELQLIHIEAESGLTALELVQSTRAALRSSTS